MAKSKSGGTRSMIRGRVGADVYSIGRDSKGQRQQVVRSLAEQVSNRRTSAQMVGRMLMATIMQAQSALKPIIDHSFDNVQGVQPNLSEFIRRNYALLKADVAANPSGNNAFGLNAWGEKGAKQGHYIVSDGKASIPAAVSFVQGTAVLTIELTAETMTMAGLKAAWEVGQYGYITIVGINTNGAADFARLHLNYSVADTTAVSSSSVASMFTISGNAVPEVAVSGNAVTITLASVAGCSNIIVTRKVASGFIHSTAILGAALGNHYTYAEAFPTYPIGEEMFLNGGSLDGSGVQASAPVVPSTPDSGTTTASAHMSSFSVGGSNLLSSNLTISGAGSTQVSGILADAETGKTYAIVRRTSAAFSQGSSASDNAQTISGTSVSFSFDRVEGETSYFALTENGTVKQVLGSLKCETNSGGGDGLDKD